MLVVRQEMNALMDEKHKLAVRKVLQIPDATFNIFQGATRCKFAIFSDNNLSAAGVLPVDLRERLANMSRA